jgi:hypothetical protein
MKKLLVLLLIGGAVIAFASCKKTCTCKTYLSGTLLTTTKNVELPEDFKKCSDLNTTDDVGTGKTGLECK